MPDNHVTHEDLMAVLLDIQRMMKDMTPKPRKVKQSKLEKALNTPFSIDDPFAKRNAIPVGDNVTFRKSTLKV